MALFNAILSYLSIVFNLCAFVIVYSLTTNRKLNINLSHIFVVFFMSLAAYTANYSLDTPFNFMVSFLVVLFLFYFFFRENINILLFKIFIIYVILSLCDALLAVIFLFNVVDASLILESITYVRGLNTILVSLILIFIFLFKKFRVFINRMIGYLNKKWSYVFLIGSLFAFLVFLMITHLNAFVLSVDVFLFSMLLISFFLFLCVVMIVQYFKNKSSEEEQKVLLNLMGDYERLLDNERINRHEILNNLVILKSFKDKSSVEYEETLDEIMHTYQGSNKYQLFSNLHKLPSGIKGIIYYKIASIHENDINLTLLSAPNIEESFDKLNQKLYFKVCKILGIVIDNAIEAASIAKDRLLLIDIYYDGGLVIYIENSFENSINLNNIHLKGVSSKGDNRGYGLYIVSKLLEDTDLLDFNQHIENNRFITVLKIKNPSQ